MLLFLETILSVEYKPVYDNSLTMEFKETQAIYMQIVDFVCDQMISGNWMQGMRIPSVRELGVLLEVNPNTVMRAYEWLQNRNIIYNKRGVGFFVGEEACLQIRAMRQHDFIGKQLPELFRNMIMLGISIEQVADEYQKYKSEKLL